VPIKGPDLEWMKKLVAWLLEHTYRGPEAPPGTVITGNASGEGLWQYPEGAFDHSNTQYAVLALAAARRCGVAVPKQTWDKLVTHFLRAQMQDGEKVAWLERTSGDKGATVARGEAKARGWGYVGPDNPTASMTSSGLACLMIADDAARSMEKRDAGPSRQVREAVRDGLAWLAKNFAVDSNPGGDMAWHYYWLYGLERVGTLSSRTYIGEHDWYRDGAEYLLAHQAADGSWSSTLGPVVDTSFALLFLRRATVPLRRPVYSGGNEK